MQRHITSAALEVFYSASPDRIAPLISQVNVAFDGATSATVQVRATDDSGSVAEVAALVNDGSWHYEQLVPSPQDPTLFSKTVTVASGVNPEVFVEATDGSNVAYSANKGSNFTSAPTVTPAGPQILIQSPVGPYGINQPVNATYQCVGAATCVGPVVSGQTIDTATAGLHAFRVTATDSSGNTSALQRDYLVTDLILKARVSPPSATTGQTVTASASLTNAASVQRDVTLSATFAYNTAFSVSTPAITVKVPAGKTYAGSFPIRIPASIPRGTYAVTLRASDLTGTVTATATLTVG
jgi:hypothetical protein